MTEQDFLEITGKTQDTRDRYNKNTGRKLIIQDTKMIEAYDYKKTLMDPAVNPEVFGITDRYCGGMVYKVAKAKMAPWHLLIAKGDITIGLYLHPDNVPGLTVEELKKTCARFNIPFDNNAVKADLVKTLTNVFS